MKAFILAGSYRDYSIKEYLANYFLHMSDISCNIHSNEMIELNERAKPYKAILADTGNSSMTGWKPEVLKKHGIREMISWLQKI